MKGPTHSPPAAQRAPKASASAGTSPLFAAMREHDRLGPAAFALKYGYEPKHRYILKKDGREYELRGLIAATNGRPGSPRPMTRAQLSASEASWARTRFLNNAFQIIKRGKNVAPAPDVAGWVVKGKRAYQSDAHWEQLLRAGRSSHWFTRKPVTGAAAAQPVFFYKASPDNVVVGTGALTGRIRFDEKRREFLVDVYSDGPVRAQLSLATLRADPVLAEASFVKAGPAGTFYPLTRAQVARLRERLSAAARAVEAQRVSSRAALAELARARAATQPLVPRSVVDARQLQLRAIASRQGQSAFRASLLAAYGGRCAVSGDDCEHALEAAHIAPYNGAATNVVHNGLLLRGDLHTLFDLGLLRIRARDYIVELAPELLRTSYARFAGRRLRLPRRRALWPARTLLAGR